MSGGGGSTNTIQSATPWLGVQSQLSNLYGQAASEFNNGGGPQAYTGQTTAPLNAQQTGNLNAVQDISNGGYGNLSGAQQSALNTTQGIVNGSDALSQSLMAGANGTTGAEGNLGAMGNGGSFIDQELQQQATGGTAPEQYLQSTLGQNYLDVSNNPALNNAMNAANYNTNFNYTNDVMPALASQYSAAGRFGSGAMGTATNQANNTLASQISNTNASMSLADLQQLQGLQSSNAATLGSQEGTAANSLGTIMNSANTNLGSLENANAGLLNNRQGAALQLLPSMATQGLTNANAGLTAGNQIQAQSQTSLTNAINQYLAMQNQPVQNLASYSGLLSGASGLNTTSTSGNTSNVVNPYSTAIGAGSLGLGAYNSGLLASGTAAGGASLFSAGGGAALSGAALDSALAGSATEGVLAGGAGGSALMGLAAA